MTRFIVAAQWQGSPAARAMLLAQGAEAIAGDLPRSATVRVDIPTEAGDALGTKVRRKSALLRVHDELLALAPNHQGHDLVVGGDCSIALGSIDRLTIDRADLAVVWFDAHADLHVPATSPSGAASGMALRAVLGEGDLALTSAINPHRVFLVGARSFDDAEADLVDNSDLHVVNSVALDADELAEAVKASGARAVYIHVDVDVIDPAYLTGVLEAVPFGISPAELVTSISRIRAVLPLAGASLAGFAPAHADAAVEDMGTLLRIVGALA